NDVQGSLFLPHLAAKTEAPEHRIIRNNRRGGSQRAAVAQVRLAGVIPGPAIERLSQPRYVMGRRLETAARPTVVRLTRKPISKAGFFRSGIHQRPRA